MALTPRRAKLPQCHAAHGSDADDADFRIQVHVSLRCCACVVRSSLQYAARLARPGGHEAVPADLLDLVGPDPAYDCLYFGLQQLAHSAYAVDTVRGQAECREPPDAYRRGAERNGFHNIRAAPDTAVQNDRYLPCRDLGDRGKLVERCGQPV